jgi:hypothetical protein
MEESKRKIETVKKIDQSPVAVPAVQPEQKLDREDAGKPAPQGGAPPTPTDVQKFAVHEETIKQNIGGFRKVGMALEGIKDGKLHRVAGFKSFEVYCRKRWGLSDKYAYRLMEAAACMEKLQNELSPIGEIRFPTNESQVRPLTPLEPDTRVKAWKQVLKVCKGKPITAEEVEAVVNKIMRKPDEEKTAKSKTESKKAERKLVTIGEMVTMALKDDSNLTVPKLKKILEEIQALVGTKK